jgi:hypothetical protein
MKTIERNKAMKKIITLILALMLMASCFTSCAVKKQEAAVDDVPNYQAGAPAQLEECMLQANETIEYAQNQSHLIVLNQDDFKYGEKFYYEYNPNDEIPGDKIIVVLKYSASKLFFDFTVDNFPELNLTEVKECDPVSKYQAKAIAMGVDIEVDGVVYKHDKEVKPGYRFRQVLALTLAEPGLENVIEAVRLLEKNNAFLYVVPNAIPCSESSIKFVKALESIS